jgi:hypothetical protein
MTRNWFCSIDARISSSEIGASVGRSPASCALRKSSSCDGSVV